MLFAAWSIGVLIAIALLVITFCVMCWVAAEQKGRSELWAVMGVFGIFGLIVVLLLDRSVSSEVSRRIEVDRMYQRYQGRSSPSEARSSAELRARGTRTYPSGATGARGAESPVTAWLSKERGASDSDMAKSPTQQRRRPAADPRPTDSDLAKRPTQQRARRAADPRPTGSDMARSPTQQRRTERSRRGREVQDEESPVAAFLSGRSGTDAEDSGKETTEGA